MKIDNSRRLILGVCSGIAADMGWNPWLVRLLFVILLHAAGLGLLVYLGLYFVMDKN
jgi:phage shock protein PspC (stress-responsive transcriptional regulator)